MNDRVLTKDKKLYKYKSGKARRTLCEETWIIIQVLVWPRDFTNVCMCMNVYMHVHNPGRCICVCIFVCVFVYSCTYFLAQPLKGPRSKDTPAAMSTPSPQILVSNTIFPLKGARTSQRKWLILGLEQSKDKTSLEHLMPQSKELLSKKQQ